MKQPRRKVVLLLPSLDLGGAEQLVLEELSQLHRDERLEVELHLLFSRGLLYPECERLGVRIVCWHAPHRSLKLVRTYWHFICYLRRHRVDVLHCHLLYLFGPWCGVLGGVRKRLATMHTLGRLSRLELLALQRCDVVLACSAQVARHLCGLRPGLSVTVLNNAVPVNATQSSVDAVAFRHSQGLSADSLLVLSAGRLIEDKGFDVLITAFAHVVAVVPNAVLLLAGAGEEKLPLLRLITELNLVPCVRLMGMVRPIRDVMAVADLYVNASRREGMAMSLIEAMAQGKAVVATRVGGNPDVVSDGETGTLVEADNPHVLAQAILELLSEPPRRQRYGQAAKARVATEFSIEKHCQQLMQYYLS